MRVVFPRQNSCADGTKWYVCASNGFQGCCSIDACANGCPDSNSQHSFASSLILSDPSSPSTTIIPISSNTQATPSTAAPKTSNSASGSLIASSIFKTFDPLPSPSISVVVITSTNVQGSTIIFSATAISTATGTAELQSSPPKSSTNTTLIGGVIGAIGALLLVITLLLYFLWWRKREDPPSTVAPEEMQPAVVLENRSRARRSFGVFSLFSGVFGFKRLSLAKSGTSPRESEKCKPQMEISIPQLEGTPVRPPELPGSLPNPLGRIPELSDEQAFPPRAELSSPIDIPGQGQEMVVAQPASPSDRGTIFIGMALDSPIADSGQGDRRQHVMSWASYDDDAATVRESDRSPSGLSSVYASPGAPDTAHWATLSPRDNG